MKFFRTLHWRFMAILFLLVISLMIIIGTFLSSSIEKTYYQNFKSDISKWSAELEASQIVSDKVVSTGEKYTEELYRAFRAYFQIDDTNRKGFLLDETGEIIFPKSTENTKIEDIEINENIMLAMTGEEGLNICNEEFFDYAKPIKIDGKVKYIFYLKESRSTINGIISSLKETILYAVFITLIVAIFLSYLLSRAITVPIYKLKSRAEKMAEGDFTPIKELKSGDEISELADKFNYMSGRLKNTLNEISKEKNKVETLLQNMNDGVIAFDTTGNLIHANFSAVKLMDLKSEQRTFEKIFNNLNLELTLSEILNSKNNNINECNIEVNGKCLKLFFAKFNDETGNSEGVIVVIQDITKQEQLEEMRKDFVANVSHELKTPITSIRGYSETLLENDMDEATREKFLGVINSEAERMSRIVSDLLQLSKMDYKENKVVISECEVNSLINKVINNISIEANKKGQIISFNPSGEILAKGEPESIEQVIINIVSNAIRYTDNNGKIDINAVEESDVVKISVKDNGIGIPKEDLPRIFERFYRVDKARTREMGGTGLGLAIAKNMIEANEGKIYIDSEFGKWTEVTIVLKKV